MTFCEGEKNETRQFLFPPPRTVSRSRKTQTNMIVGSNLVERSPDRLRFGKRVGFNPSVRCECDEVLARIDGGIEVAEHGGGEHDAFRGETGSL